MPELARETGWFKSSRSAAASDNCVEVRLSGGSVQVRDSKAPGDGTLKFRAAAWESFLGTLKG